MNHLFSAMPKQVASVKKIRTYISVTGCTITPHVDRHIVRSALDTSTTPVLGWVISALCVSMQMSYALHVSTVGGIALNEAPVQSNRSEGIAYPAAPLAPGTAHLLTVTSYFSDGSSATGSAPFVTALSAMSTRKPMWHANSSAKYVLFRAVVPAVGASATGWYLAITAKPSPAWNLPHGVNSSHLLCGYKLWWNGVPLGVGPGRMVGGRIALDTFNVSSLLKAAEINVIAISAYYESEPGADSVDAHGGVVAMLHSGDTSDGAVAMDWLSFDATSAVNPSGNAGTHYYTAPHENYLGKLYPFGWRTAATVTACARAKAWVPALSRAPFADGLAAKRAIPVSLRTIRAHSFTTLPPPSPMSYRYVIDFGRNIQGHVNISFVRGKRGQQVVVRLGEQLLANGSVKWVSESGNRWSDVWTLRGGGDERGAQLETYVPHEYAEFRWAEVIGAPDPPAHERLGGWQVHYAFDGELNEEGQAEAREAGAPSARGVTHFETSDAKLRAVWELVRYTIVGASLDLNTDSNTRQRDLCTLDAWLASRYQGGVAPASAVHLRRRVTQIMWEPKGYVNYWSEFLVAHVGALHDYTLDFGDTTLAASLWNLSWSFPLPTSAAGASKEGGHAHASDEPSPPPQNVEVYSLTAFWNASTGLVHATPMPLIDWPRSSGIDTDGESSHRCDELCVQMNSYAALAHGWAASLAEAVGNASSAALYAARGETIRKEAQAAFATAECDVGDWRAAVSPSMRCYRDNLASVSPAHTSATATATAALARLPGSASGVLALVPFLMARNGRRGDAHGVEVSGWMAGFMLEALYRAAGEVEEGPLPPAAVARAAEYAHSVLTGSGNNSWLSMLAQNATMTMESWLVPSEGGGTFSHPWTAAPAYLIPRFLMGVRPLEAAWRRFMVRPLPPASLRRASIVLPTIRGEVTLAFVATGAAFTANVTVPGNTLAQLCLPRYLLSAPADAIGTSASCTISVGGEARPLLAGGVTGGLACLAHDLGPGHHVAVLSCDLPPVSGTSVLGE